MPYSDEVPSYLLMAARSADEIQFAVDSILRGIRMGRARLGDIPGNGYEPSSTFCNFTEAELGGTAQLDEYATLTQLADDMVQFANRRRS